MSTLAYAALTTKRDVAKPGTSQTTEPPGVRTYLDALAALIPAEVLSLHAVIISVTTKVEGTTTTIVNGAVLAWAFWGLVVVAAALYATPRLLDKKWDELDWIRVFIPPLAFVGWTMMQRATAFDAVFPQIAQSDAARTVAALFLAVILGAAATALAYKADAKKPKA